MKCSRLQALQEKLAGETARKRLAAEKQVRAVMRDVNKGHTWSERGRDVGGADMNDPVALTKGF